METMRKVGYKAVWAVGLGVAAASLGAYPGFGLERVSLRNGFSVDCERREPVGDKVRLYLPGSVAGQANYVEVAADAVTGVEMLPDAPKTAAARLVPAAAGREVAAGVAEVGAALTAEEMREMLSQAGGAHHVDADLLASVVRAESGGRVRAVSRTGAQGLMQLMPGTAAELGVGDTFEPRQNINGGTAYLDALLTRYHDNLPLALAAYNAGPKAVDRYHGVPPYRETRAYVARVIREFNRRKLLAISAVVARPTR